MRSAEEVVKSFLKTGRDGKQEMKLTTSQIRKILSGTNLIANKIKIHQVENGFKDDKLSQELVDEINCLRIRILYQAGRDREGIVKEFVEKAELDKRLKDVGESARKFSEFNRFIEEIVAYHRYHGGR